MEQVWHPDISDYLTALLDVVNGLRKVVVFFSRAIPTIALSCELIAVPLLHPRFTIVIVREKQ